MKNLSIAITLLLNLFARGAEVSALIAKATASGQDLSDDDLNTVRAKTLSSIDAAQTAVDTAKVS